MAFTSGELDSSLRELNDILEDLIRLAELEKTAQLLAEEIERTRRRVNALEYILMPQYLATIKTIKMKLDENERGNTTRLMKVKDMMLQAQLTQKHTDDEEE
jgi:V/A-type H+-transporting ATPase subunit D